MWRIIRNFAPKSILQNLTIKNHIDMRKSKLLINHGLRSLFILTALVLGVQGAWAQSITVAGISPNSDGNFIDPTNSQPIDGVTFDATSNTLTLNGATITGGIVYYGVETLTIELNGTNSVSPVEDGTIAYDGDEGTLVIKKANDAEDCSLELTSSSNDFSVISGFTDVSWNGLNVRADWIVTYSECEKKLVYSNYDNAEHVIFTTGAGTYPLTIAGVLVTTANASDVLADGTVSFAVTGDTAPVYTLTLNGATLSGGIQTRLSSLNIDILGENSITSSEGAVIESLVESGTSNVTFTSTGSTHGKLTLTPASNSQAWENIYAQYDFDVRLFGLNEDHIPTEGSPVVVRKVPGAVFNFPQGVVFTDEDLTIVPTIANDEFDIYYNTRSRKRSQLDYLKYTNPIRLTTDDSNDGNASVYAYTALKTDTDNNYTHSSESCRSLIVLDRPTFSVPGGNYTTAQTVVLNGLPELGTREGYVEGEVEVQMFPQVRYYFDGDAENAVKYIVGSNIAIDHTCTLNAYLLAINDSNAVVRSSVFSAEYILPLDAPTITANGITSNVHGAVITYSIDYADDTEDITNATYDAETAPFPITKSCTITAHAEYGENTSATTTAKYFGFADTELDIVIGGTASVPAIVPAIAEEDVLTVSYSSNNTVLATVSEGEVSAVGTSVGATSVVAKLTYEEEPSFTILNASDYDQQENIYYQLEGVTVNVVPQKPGVTVAAGTYDETQSVEITSAYTGEGTKVIKYYLGDPETITWQTYESAISITESTKLTAKVEVTDNKGQTFSSDTTQVTYVIRTAPEMTLSYTGRQSVTYGETLAAPTVTITGIESPTVTWKSSNTAIATVNAETGVVTPVRATTTDETVEIKALFAGNETLKPDSVSYLLIVDKADITITLTPAAKEGLVYTSEAQALVTAGTSSHGTIVYSLAKTGEYSETIPTGTDAGDYKVFFKVEGDANYNGTEVDSVSVSIAQAKPVLSFTPTAATYVFGTEFEEPVLTNESEVTVTYSIASTSETTVATIDAETGKVTAVAPGTATVTATYEGDTNHEGTSASYTLTVEAGESSVATAPVAIENLVYTGKAQALVTAGSATNGTMKYSLDKENGFGTDIPTATDAGSYKVYYRVEGDANYNGTEVDSVSVSIAQAKPVLSFTPTAATYVFGTEFEEPVLTNESEVTVTYSIASTSETTVATIDAETGKVTAVAPGTATVTATYEGDTNHEGTSASYTLTVEAGESSVATAPVAIENLVYTGAAQALVTAGSAANGTMKYSLDKEDGYSTDVPTATDAGSYKVYYKVEGDANYNGTEVDSVSVSIAQAKPVLAFTPAAATYVFGTEFEEPVLTNESEVTVTYSIASASETTVATIDAVTGKVTAVAPGTATVTATYAGDNNHEGTSASYTLTVEAGQAVVATAPVAKTDLIYTGQAQALVTAGSAINGTMKYSLDKEEGYSTDVPTATNAGDYTVYYLVEGAANYNNSDTLSVKVSIAKAMPTVTAPVAKTLTYTGEAQELVEAGSADFGTVVYSLEREGTYSENIPTATEAGDYTVYYAVMESDNYFATDTASVSVSIARAILQYEFAEGQNWATYYTTSENLSLSAGIVAHVVTGISGSTVTTQGISYVPKNVPVLLEKTTATVTTNDDIAANLLYGTTEPQAVSSIMGGVVYVLYNNEFVKSVSGTIPANRAYLVVDGSAVSGSRLHIVHGDDATGIADVLKNAATDVWFSVDGRKLGGKPSKRGLYIKNGQKVYINK